MRAFLQALRAAKASPQLGPRLVGLDIDRAKVSDTALKALNGILRQRLTVEWGNINLENFRDLLNRTKLIKAQNSTFVTVLRRCNLMETANIAGRAIKVVTKGAAKDNQVIMWPCLVRAGDHRQPRPARPRRPRLSRCGWCSTRGQTGCVEGDAGPSACQLHTFSPSITQSWAALESGTAVAIRAQDRVEVVGQHHFEFVPLVLVNVVG